MNFTNHTITLVQVKVISYLSTLGFKPSKIRGQDFWFFSPFREERTPSFKVNQQLNCWYDHGIGKGGTLIDFGVHYYNCTPGELLQNLSGTFLLQQPIILQAEDIGKQEPKIKILKAVALASSPLLRYLEHRIIPIEIAQHYCSEEKKVFSAKIKTTIHSIKTTSDNQRILNYRKMQNSEKH
ncbi:CHC2 zinc finger domain-containing protein [Flavobacterium sp. ZS1P14]|uniref:CHC2 zinc finger domain-containing protein n=1 Tax=Flavobacterium sp. ZS1P14 TaxID=3401729 RepID=UPI003AAF8F1A